MPALKCRALMQGLGGGPGNQQGNGDLSLNSSKELGSANTLNELASGFFPLTRGPAGDTLMSAGKLAEPA